MIRNFWGPWVEELAHEIERDFKPQFAPHGAEFKVLPVRITHLSEVGEGVELALVPDDLKRWKWWGDFESDLEIRRRRRFGGSWIDLLSREDVASWLRSEAKSYLSRLDEASSSDDESS